MQLRKEHPRTWYGVDVDITVTKANFHLVKFLHIPLPHPGLVNWFARQGLDVDTRLSLTARHEFGHLQTLPIPLLHLLLLICQTRKQSRLTGLPRFLLILLTHQALWEVAAESYVVATDRRAVTAPRPPWAYALYGFFWGSVALFSLFGTLFLLGSDTETL